MARAREEEVHEAFVAPRGMKRLLPGERPAPLSEVAGRSGATASCGAPQGTLLSWCCRCSSVTKRRWKKEQAEARREELEDEVLDDKLEAELDALMAPRCSAGAAGAV